MAQRGRPKKYPDRNPEGEREELVSTACGLAREPFDDRVDRNSSLPTIETIAEIMNTTTVKVRKLLITGGYYTTGSSRMVQKLYNSGMGIQDIAEETNLSEASVSAYLPYRKGAYNLDAPSQDAMHSKKARARKKAISTLKDDPTSLNLWKAVILFQDYLFTTAGRGEKPGVKFRYSIPSKPGNSGRKYEGEEVKGWGNELFIEGREKSISRSSVDYALRIALNDEVTGPKSLKIYGSSYVYAMFQRFGLI